MFSPIKREKPIKIKGWGLGENPGIFFQIRKKKVEKVERKYIVEERGKYNMSCLVSSAGKPYQTESRKRMRKSNVKKGQI